MRKFFVLQHWKRKKKRIEAAVRRKEIDKKKKKNEGDGVDVSQSTEDDAEDPLFFTLTINSKSRML